jgi:thiol:disulfide interchange protein DsbD
MRTILIALYLFINTTLLFAVAPPKPVVTVKISESTLLVSFNIPDGFHQIKEKSLFKFSPKPVKGIIFGPLIYPDTAVKGQYGDEYHGETILKRRIVLEGLPPDATKIKLTASYQLCNDKGSCFMPEDIEKEITIPESLLKRLPSTAPDGMLLQEEGDGLFMMLLFAFFGGLILNLMPCVLPVLSIKMFTIVNNAHSGKSAIFKGSLVYTFGVLISFLILALFVVFLKASGEAVGWGFQFQNIYFVFGLFIFTWGFAFSMFELFFIQLPGVQLASKASSFNGCIGTFMSGVFAVLLATPCTAPMLGTAIGFALKQSSFTIILIMLTVGLGLASPFIILGAVPSVVKIIPKPGNWMNTFSHLMGFLLIGTSLFLLRTLYFITSFHQFFNIIWFTLIFTFALWIFGSFNRPHLSKYKQWGGISLAVIITFLAAWCLLDFFGANLNSESITNSDSRFSVKEGWQLFSPELLQKLQEEKKMVFVDFSAEWCMTCKSNETLILNSKSVKKAFSEHNVEMLYGDFTRKNPLILEWLKKYNKAGVPLYLLFKPGESKPIVFPELITKKMIINALTEKK